MARLVLVPGWATTRAPVGARAKMSKDKEGIFWGTGQQQRRCLRWLVDMGCSWKLSFSVIVRSCDLVCMKQLPVQRWRPSAFLQEGDSVVKEHKCLEPSLSTVKGVKFDDAGKGSDSSCRQ